MTAPTVAPDALWAYLRAVAERLGVGIESCTVDIDPPASAYLAVDGHAPNHPGRDLALLWDERHGWSAAVETPGEDLRVLGYLGGLRAVADPDEVAGFVAAVRDGWSPSMRPAEFARTDDLDDYLSLGNTGETSPG